jgi:uncharacterized surface protein with fasciclin (FAS1) repeats
VIASEPAPPPELAALPVVPALPPVLTAAMPAKPLDPPRVTSMKPPWPGPFTVFAPTNAAFEQLPAGTVEMLLKPENKAALTKVLTYHVVAGKWDSKALAKLISKGKGKAWLKTVSGGKLTAWMDGDKIVLQDEKGGTSTVTTADVYQSNGVIHVVNAVLMPN